MRKEFIRYCETNRKENYKGRYPVTEHITLDKPVVNAVNERKREKWETENKGYTKKRET